MGRSAKKKAFNGRPSADDLREEFQEDEEIEDDINLTEKVFDSYSKFILSDSSERSLIWKASINFNPASSFLEREDFLFKFIRLLEENRVELESAFAKKKHFTFKKKRVSLKNKSSEILVKNMLSEQSLISTNSLMTDTFFSNLFASAFLSQEPAFNLIFTLLNDRMYQVFNECSSRVYTTLDRIEKELHNPDEMKHRIEENNKLEYNFFVGTLITVVPGLLREAEYYYKQIPGFNKLNVDDFTKIIESKMLDYYFVVNSALFIGDESYYYISDQVIYTRFWMNSFRPKEFVDIVFDFMAVFNPLKLSKREKALLIAYILSQSG
jgi:hypothetical protein